MGAVFWLGAMVLFLVVEAFTTSLVSIWFALGSLIAGVCSYFHVPESICVLVFAVVSAISLAVFKKFYSKKIAPKTVATNADRLIGEKGTVENDIDPIKGKGTVDVHGRVWSAKAEEPIEKDSVVEVCAIEGVKLLVRRI